MTRDHKIRNFSFLSSYSHFTPTPVEILAILLFFICGVLISNAFSIVILKLIPEVQMEAANLVCYPLMFIPPMIYASHKSLMNATFETGYNIDSSNFGKSGGWASAGMVMIATIALAYLMDMINVLMPPIPERLERIIKVMMEGNIIMNFICLGIFAPFFEEWLCRGMVLRGLLNFRKRHNSASDRRMDGTESDRQTGLGSESIRGIRPIWAIILSSAFFALIHMNPWQAVPAFALGCLFGYVYWRTGSLRLTMLMHFTNNTFALLMSKIDSLKEAKTWLDVMPVWEYAIFAFVALAFMLFFFKQFQDIPLQSSQGGCSQVDI